MKEKYSETYIQLQYNLQKEKKTRQLPSIYIYQASY